MPEAADAASALPTRFALCVFGTFTDPYFCKSGKLCNSPDVTGKVVICCGWKIVMNPDASELAGVQTSAPTSAAATALAASGFSIRLWCNCMLALTRPTQARFGCDWS